MRQKPAGQQSSSEQIIRDIKRKTRKQYSARIMLDGLRGEDSIAELAIRERLGTAVIPSRPVIGADRVHRLTR